jgi:hypothetical protein
MPIGNPDESDADSGVPSLQRPPETLKHEAFAENRQAAYCEGSPPGSAREGSRSGFAECPDLRGMPIELSTADRFSIVTHSRHPRYRSQR